MCWAGCNPQYIFDLIWVCLYIIHTLSFLANRGRSDRGAKAQELAFLCSIRSPSPVVAAGLPVRPPMPRAFSSPSRSPPRQRHALPPPPRHRRTLSSTLVEESVAAAAALVKTWHPDVSCSLFLHDATGQAEEAQGFLRAAAELHRAMLFFAADTTNPSSQSGHGLVQAQELLQTAMRRLQLELQFLLDKHDESQQAAGASAAAGASSIRAVAEAMMAAGYGKECISTFKSHRRTALATKLQRLLGFSPPAGTGSSKCNSSSSSSLFHKLT